MEEIAIKVEKPALNIADLRKQYKTGAMTHTGEKLTIKQDKFIDLYIAYGDKSRAVREAGYNTKSPSQQADNLLAKPEILDEIEYRLNQYKSTLVADTQEILEYFTAVMRGQVTDQFGLDAPLAERTKAAQELAKRQIDFAMANKAASEGKKVSITLNWTKNIEDRQLK